VPVHAPGRERTAGGGVCESSPAVVVERRKLFFANSDFRYRFLLLSGGGDSFPGQQRQIFLSLWLSQRLSVAKCLNCMMVRIVARRLLYSGHELTSKTGKTIMELYFKDFEGEEDLAEMSMDQGHDFAEVQEESDEEAAFAELAERVSAARLVF
jgi:hypothetical protein